MKKIYFLFLLIAFSSVFSQPLRKSVLSVSSGFVAENNSADSSNAMQFFFWGNYQFSSLDEISLMYKKYLTAGYDESLVALKASTNFFPFYFTFSFGQLGESSTQASGRRNVSYTSSSADFYYANATYYHKLVFYSLSLEHVSINWDTKEKVYSAEAKVTWRPSKDLSFTIGSLYAQSDNDTSYADFSFEAFWQPVYFFNVSFKGYFGEHRYYYDGDYMIMYSFPYTEKGSESLYFRFYPWKTFSLIFNYESRKFDTFNVDYFSLSFRYDFL